MSLQTFDPIEVNSEKNLKLADLEDYLDYKFFQNLVELMNLHRKSMILFIGRVPCYLSFYNHISVGIGYATENEWILKWRVLIL